MRRYRHYKERVPRFAWALWLLVVIEVAMGWRLWNWKAGGACCI
jgi:hypothetical protein